jgi:hypothetical protein
LWCQADNDDEWAIQIEVPTTRRIPLYGPAPECGYRGEIEVPEEILAAAAAVRDWMTENWMSEFFGLSISGRSNSNVRGGPSD